MKYPERIEDQTIEECQSYHYLQSKQTSTLTRQLVYGIMGTIWVLSFNNGHFYVNNKFYYLVLIFSLAFMLFDVFHYFLDSLSYRKEYFKIVQGERMKEESIKHEDFMIQVSERSFMFLKIKFGLCMFVSLMFVIGFVLSELG